MKVSIRWALILGFLIVIWGTYGITTTSLYVSSEKVLNQHAHDIMQNIADLVIEQSSNHLAHAHGAAVLTRRLIGANVVSASQNRLHLLERYFYDQLAIYPHFAGIYLGRPNGDFFYVSRNAERTPKGYRTKIITHHDGIRKTRLIWRNQNLKAVADETDPADAYDPRIRPWYKKARAEKQIVWTDPYIFYTSQKPGITIAGPIYGQSGDLEGIVGVDLEIDQLSSFIASLNIGKNGRAFMFNRNGDVIAFPDLKKIRIQSDSTQNGFRLVKIQELDDILCRKTFLAAQLKFGSNDRFIMERPAYARFEHDGRYHRSMLIPFATKQWPWIIGVHLPEDDYLGALKQNRRHNILVTLAISVFATILGLFLSRSIIRPISNLEKEARAVKNDQLDARFKITSQYKEIQETAEAFIRMKTAIRKSRKKYQGIFENIQDIYYEVTLEGKVLEISPSVEKITGFRRDEFIGKNINDFYVEPSARERFIAKIMADGKVSDYEVLLEADGRQVYFALNSVLVVDDQNQQYKIIGSMRDISTRKQAEEMMHNHRERLEELVEQRTEDLTAANAKLLKEIEQRQATESALREKEEKYRNILENIEEGYFETDLSGNFTFVNKASAKILGWTREELVGMNNRDYSDPRSAQKIYQTFNDVYRTGKPRDVTEFKVIRKDNQERSLEISISLMHDGNQQAIGFRGIGRDVTDRIRAVADRKKLEEQLQQSQRLEAIGTLAGGIAHDFNNLLMGIQGNVSLMLLEYDQNKPQHEKLKNIENCVKSGARLTKLLLGYARGGKYVVTPTNVNELIQETAHMFGRTRKEISITETYQEDLWTVEVDKGQIEQVLINLYLNAWHAMANGGELSLQTANSNLDRRFTAAFEAKPGRYVKISIADTGVGIGEAIRHRIFEPFFTTKEIGHGTGLGLASAYGIIRNHDGIIHFDSKVGQGTTFYIFLPASDKPVTTQTIRSANHNHHMLLEDKS